MKKQPGVLIAFRKIIYQKSKKGRHLPCINGKSIYGNFNASEIGAKVMIKNDKGKYLCIFLPGRVRSKLSSKIRIKNDNMK